MLMVVMVLLVKGQGGEQEYLEPDKMDQAVLPEMEVIILVEQAVAVEIALETVAMVHLVAAVGEVDLLREQQVGMEVLEAVAVVLLVIIRLKVALEVLEPAAAGENRI